MSAIPSITTIVPTLAEASRREQLFRAIRSVTNQNGAEAAVLVVVNGTRFDRALLAELKGRSDITVHYQELGSLPLAMRTGRELVRTDFFCFLDDDDIYLPGAFSARLALLLSDPSIDAVVSNGYRSRNGVRRPFADDCTMFSSNPLLHLFSFNWLPSCGGLFRTATVPGDFFDPDVHYREYTHLAFRLALERRIAFVNDHAFEITETEGSLSKQAQYELASPALYEKMLKFKLDNKIRSIILSRRTDSFHSISEYFRRSGQHFNAWRYHAKSICTVDGFIKYALFTRKLISPVRRLD